MAGRSAANPKPLPRRPWTLGASGESTRACACAVSASPPRPPALISWPISWAWRGATRPRRRAARSCALRSCVPAMSSSVSGLRRACMF
eukprot:scaffold97983_cov49-Phaeocystis_antarctica.AAC.1